MKQYSHKVGLNFWHIEFGTKYRYKMLGKFKQHNIAEASIKNVCKSHHIKIHALEIMPDHVHMLVTLPHNMTESEALQVIKGGSAYRYFKNHPKSRMRLPQGHLWSAGGCATTVGYNEYDTVFSYIEKQREHHGAEAIA